MTKTRTSSRDSAVAGRVAAQAPGLGVPLFPEEQPLANTDRRDGATGSGAHDHDHQRASTGGLFAEADAVVALPPSTFDSARIEWPGIGLAIYALDPGGPVVLEVHSEGEVYRFEATTAAEALALAFPQRRQDDVLG